MKVCIISWFTLPLVQIWSKAFLKIDMSKGLSLGDIWKLPMKPRSLNVIHFTLLNLSGHLNLCLAWKGLSWVSLHRNTSQQLDELTVQGRRVQIGLQRVTPQGHWTHQVLSKKNPYVLIVWIIWFYNNWHLKTLASVVLNWSSQLK